MINMSYRRDKALGPQGHVACLGRVWDSVSKCCLSCIT